MTNLMGKEWVDKMDYGYLEEGYKAIEYLEDPGYTKQYTPDLETAFYVFRRLPPSRIKAVICSLCPYPDGTFDGIAFSCSRASRIAPTLQSVYEGACYDLGVPEHTVNFDPDLRFWVEQGVFPINMKLTVELGDSRSHSNIGWENFMLGVFKVILRENKDTPICLWGGDAKVKYEKTLSKLGKNILTESHPVSAAKMGTLWITDHFSRINNILGADIKWVKHGSVNSSI